MINIELIRSFIDRHLKITIIIAVTTGMLSYFLTTLFPGMDSSDAESISSSWPQIMKDLFGDPIYAFTDIYAWMNLQIYHITLWAVFGVLASLLAADIVAKEIEEKTMDVLLSTPVTRAGIVLSRLVGIIIIMTMSMLPVFTGCGLGTLASGNPVKLNIVIIAIIFVLLLALVFAAVTLFVSVFVPRQTYAVSITVGIFGLMFLHEELLAKLVPFLGGLTFISPFHYYRPQDILIYDTFSIADPLILLIFFTVTSIISSVIFSHQDIIF